MPTAVTLPHSSGEVLLHWAECNKPGDQIYWKEPFWRQISFVREKLNGLFRKTYQEYDANPVRVISTHRSKSVNLPVYSIAVPNTLTVVLRNNFYNWAISVESAVPVPDNFYNLFDRTTQEYSVYCEGFDDSWVFPPYASNQQRFSLRLGDNYFLHTFCYLLSQGLGLSGDRPG